MLKPPAFPNLPVLVVDDSAFARRIVRNMLEPVGIRHVVEAPNGEDALQRLTQFKPGLIVLDWNLPVLSAFDLLAILRDPTASTETHVPVIVVTGSPTRRLIDQAALREVKHVLRKPFAPKALWQRISTFYGKLAPMLDVRVPLDAPLLTDQWSRPVQELDTWDVGGPELTVQ